MLSAKTSTASRSAFIFRSTRTSFSTDGASSRFHASPIAVASSSAHGDCPSSFIVRSMRGSIRSASTVMAARITPSFSPRRIAR